MPSNSPLAPPRTHRTHCVAAAAGAKAAQAGEGWGCNSRAREAATHRVLSCPYTHIVEHKLPGMWSGTVFYLGGGGEGEGGGGLGLR